MNSTTYDLAVIGGGPGGYVAAIRAAQLGMKTALIEKSDLGGVCLNWGCIPTKALLRSTEVLSLLKDSQQYGISCENINYDLSNIVKRSRSISNQLKSGVKHLLIKNKVTIFEANATIANTDNNLITLNLSSDNDSDGTSITAKKTIIATGASARNLDIFPNHCENIWTYKQALIPKSLPKKMVIIGAGVIGIEFASIYNTLGSEVHIVEAADKILATQDDDVITHVSKALTNDGIKIYTKASIKQAQQNHDTTWNIELNDTKINDIDIVLVAIGVAGNSNHLGLEKTGVCIEKSFIKTNQFGATDHHNIYAIGDIAGAPCLAHKATREAIICVEHIAGLKPQPINKDDIPACVYSHPQIASIGLTESAAKNMGYEVNIGHFPTLANGKALAMGYKDGFTKVIFDKNTGELLGAHMVGSDVPELIQGFGIAKNLETTEQDLMNTIFAHPTLSETMHESVLNAYKKAIHF